MASTVDVPGSAASPAVVSVGVRPTVPGGDCLLEAHLLDFGGDLYGRRIRVQLLHFLRAEARFENLERLRVQMQADIAQARAWLQANS
jgi:riboflavin kinase / FMN adenylyltransferase